MADMVNFHEIGHWHCFAGISHDAAYGTSADDLYVLCPRNATTTNAWTFRFAWC
jgi:hypothetical protein